MRDLLSNCFILYFVSEFIKPHTRKVGVIHEWLRRKSSNDKNNLMEIKFFYESLKKSIEFWCLRQLSIAFPYQ